MVISKKKAISKKSGVKDKKEKLVRGKANAKVAVTPKTKEPLKTVETAKTTKATGATKIAGTTKAEGTVKANEAAKVAATVKSADTVKATNKNDNVTKAEKLRKYFQKKKMDMFAIEELQDDNKTAVFRTRMEIGNTLLPMAILLDNSAYVLIQVELLPNFMKNDDQFVKFFNSLNALNNAIRPFKFTLSGKGDFMLNMVLTFPENKFDPVLCHAFLVEVMKYLEKDYKDLVNACLKVRDK